MSNPLCDHWTVLVELLVRQNHISKVLDHHWRPKGHLLKNDDDCRLASFPTLILHCFCPSRSLFSGKMKYWCCGKSTYHLSRTESIFFGIQNGTFIWKGVCWFDVFLINSVTQSYHLDNSAFENSQIQRYCIRRVSNCRKCHKKS